MNLYSEYSAMYCIHMRSAIHDVLPIRLRRSLSKFGHDLAVARRKRHLTVAMMAERTGLAKGTYLRIEKGDPSVSMGAYAMALFVLGFGEVFSNLTDACHDEAGLLLDEERLPKRVRVKKISTLL
jgi:DNA-binding XRE family transcriptional regulator